MKSRQQNILFFDGACNLCNALVDFTIRQDRKKIIRFAPLQGITARQVLPDDIREDMQSVVYIRNGKLLTRSSAILALFNDLGALWRLTNTLYLIPNFLRDPIYLFIARRRYRWFGKRDTCRVADPLEKSVFLD